MHLEAANSWVNLTKMSILKMTHKKKNPTQLYFNLETVKAFLTQVLL